MIQERDESGSLRAVYSVREADDHKIPREVVVRAFSSQAYLRMRIDIVPEREIRRRQQFTQPWAHTSAARHVFARWLPRKCLRR